MSCVRSSRRRTQRPCRRRQSATQILHCRPCDHRSSRCSASLSSQRHRSRSSWFPLPIRRNPKKSMSTCRLNSEERSPMRHPDPTYTLNHPELTHGLKPSERRLIQEQKKFHQANKKSSLSQRKTMPQQFPKNCQAQLLANCLRRLPWLRRRLWSRTRSAAKLAANATIKKCAKSFSIKSK